MKPEDPKVGRLLEGVGEGPPLAPSAELALKRLMGARVGLRGLSQLFQPGFPGVRAFAVEVRAAPDQAVELTLVGIARNGAPVWTGSRAFAHGRDGSLEIHRGFDEIEPTYQSRNITVDLMQRELDILALLPSGPNARLTIDAEGIGRYVCTLHGFIFADETDEGPPVRSTRALEPEGDRQRLIEASPRVVQRAAKREGIGQIGIEAAVEQFSTAQIPWDFALVTLPGTKERLAEGDDGTMGVGALGREFLLAEDTPAWRAALYLHLRDKRSRELGQEYRKRKTIKSEARIAQEIQEGREGLTAPQKSQRIRALRALGMAAPAWLEPEIQALARGSDRRLAAVARQTLRQISGEDLPDRMLSYVADNNNDGRLRGLACRVLAEYFADRLQDKVTMFRIHPDARLQKAVVPLVADSGMEAGPNIATMLAANPWTDGNRPGLLPLRLELIEKLSQLRDPRTLPALMAAYRTEPSPPPAEMLALSRALVSFPDPRAQMALIEVARRRDRPPIP